MFFYLFYITRYLLIVRKNYDVLIFFFIGVRPMHDLKKYNALYDVYVRVISYFNFKQFNFVTF